MSMSQRILLLEPAGHADKSSSALWLVDKDDSCNVATLIDIFQLKDLFRSFNRAQTLSDLEVLNACRSPGDMAVSAA